MESEHSVRITKDMDTNQKQEQSKPQDELKTRFVELLQATGREGIDGLIENLTKLGFFIAPASTKYHCAEVGGLCRHSLCVYDQARAIRKAELELHPELEDRLQIESIAIAALLHDICKAEIYKPCTRNRKNEATGQWEKYWTWEAEYDHCPMGHGEKSVIRILTNGVKLTPDEMMAIRWHMGAWDLPDSFEAKGNLGAACEKSPLLDVIMAADELATRVTEVLYEKQKKEAEEAAEKEKKEEGK